MTTKNFMSEKMEELKERISKCKKQQENIERDLGKLHAEAEVPRPLMLDEVSASFVSFLRVQSWEDLGTEFGGYKVGRILAYILDVLCTEIEDSTAATIRVDVPLYEQCPTVKMRYDKNFDFGEQEDSICKCGGKCKHNESKSEADEVKNEMTLIKMENEVLHCRAFLREIRKIIYKFSLSPAPQNIKDEVSEVLKDILVNVKQGLKEEEIQCQ